MSPAPVITIFVRHSAGCKWAPDEFAKRCNCRKHFRWTHNGTQFRQKAGTRSWAEAEDLKRKLEDQLAGRTPDPDPADTAQYIRAAVTAFLTDKEVSDISKGVRDKYTRELGRFASFCESLGVHTAARITPALVTSYKATWTKDYESSFTRANVQKRLKCFLKFCVYNEWLQKVPKMAPVKITEPPTQPVTDAEYEAILAAVPGVFPNGVGHKIRGVIQLMRWSGLSVRDASGLRRDELVERGDHFAICKQRQKIVAAKGTDKAPDMYIPIPLEIGRKLAALKNAHPDYVFWEPRKSETNSFFSHNMSVAISDVFDAAGVSSDGHMVSHRLRDTFACDLLTKGVALEDVSKLLGHKSVVTTEKHYASWVQARQNRLDKLVMATWSPKKP